MPTQEMIIEINQPNDLDLQADSRTHVQNGRASLMQPCYLYLDLPKHCSSHALS